MIIQGKFSSLLHKNIRCGCSLESPRPETILMHTHNIYFYGDIKAYVVGVH